MRRIASSFIPRAIAPISCVSRRWYTPPEDLKKLFDSDFDKQKFPVVVPDSDVALFAKFLFKSCEAKGNFDVVSKDLASVATSSSKLPVFWERNVDVTTSDAFKGVSPQTLFVLRWMQVNAMLDQLKAVTNTFDTFVNAHKKRSVATITLPGPEKEFASQVAEAKEAAKNLQKELADRAGFALDFQFEINTGIVSGYTVEVGGKVYSTAKGGDLNKGPTEDSIDYTNVPTPKVAKTEWEDSIETDVLRKYIDGLATYDGEEAKAGF